MHDDLMTIAEAARHYGVSEGGVRTLFVRSGVPFHEIASRSAFGRRVLQAVRKSDLDRLVAAGFLTGGSGRRRGGLTSRKVLLPDAEPLPHAPRHLRGAASARELSKAFRG
jgi:hypothetical protein